MAVTRNRKPLMKLLLAITVLIGFVAVVIYALLMQEDIRRTDVDLPLIAAPDVPVKRRPNEPGGLEIPNRDKRVFDLLAQTPDNPATAIQPTPELEFLALPTPTPTAAPITELAAAPVASAPEVPTAPVAVPPVLAPSAVAQPQTPPAPATAPTPALKTQELAAVSGVWGVQLASFVNPVDAERALTTFLDRYAEVLGNLTPDVQKVELDQGRGSRYRARFVGASDKASANQICTALKQQNQGCLVVQR